MPDPRVAAEEMFRVVRPGGRLLALVWGPRSKCGWAEIFPIVDRRVASEVCPMFFQLGTGDALAETLRAAGTADVGAERMSVSLEYGSDEEACGAAFAGGPVALAYSRFGQSTRAEVHAEYLASIARYRTVGGYQIPGEFVIVRGLKPAA